MKQIYNIGELQENQYYLFTPKEGLAPYLCGVYRTNFVAKNSGVFSVYGRNGEWRFDSYVTIFAIGE